MPTRRSSSPVDTATPAVAGTAAFSKFMQVLQIVADSPEPLSIAAIARLSDYPRPTVHRIVQALVAERMLVERAGTGTLGLGPRLLQLASRSWGRSEFRLAAVEELKQLRDVTSETVHLAVPNGAVMTYIEKLESPSAVRMASRIGASVSLHSTAVGKAYLSRLDRDRREALIGGLELTRHTPNSIKSLAALRRQIDETAARGWSIDDEENEHGIQCFGCAVLGPGGEPVAAVSVSTLKFRQKDDPLTTYVEPLRQACQAISDRIAATPSLSAADLL